MAALTVQALNAAGDPTQNFLVTESGYSGSLFATIQGDTTVARVSPHVQNGDPVNGVIFVVNGMRNGTCDLVIQDSNGQSITVSVVVSGVSGQGTQAGFDGGGSLTATVTVNVAPQAYFNSSFLETAHGTFPMQIPLVDGVTGATGDGLYELVFVNNEQAVYATGFNGPAIHVVKGTQPVTDLTQVHRLQQITVVGGQVAGTRDVRAMGGISIQNMQPNSVGTSQLIDSAVTTSKIQDGAVTKQKIATGVISLANDSDVVLTSPTNGQFLEYNGSVWVNANLPTDTDSLATLTDVTLTSPANNDVLTYETSSSKWKNKPVVTSLAGLNGVLTLGSSDSSVTITPAGTNIDLKAAGGGGGGGAPASYDAMIKSEPGIVYYWPLSDAGGSTSAADTQFGRTIPRVGTPTLQTSSLIFNGDLSTTFASTAGYYGTPFGITLLIFQSVECWFKFPSLPGSTASLVGSRTASTGWDITVNTSGQLIITCSNVGAFTTSVTFSANTVYHLVVCTDGVNFYVFVNGSLSQSFTNNTAFATSGGGQPFAIAAQPYSGTGAGQGVIMQKVAIYNTLLQSARVLAHYNGGHAGTYTHAW